jgi:hypothetical protein
MIVVAVPVIAYFYCNRLNLNAIDAGDETPRASGCGWSGFGFSACFWPRF